ncbi:MAG TPA: hypothetical protein VNS34_04095 [Rhizobiaceae bacterium]|nr:hypothetical protein [Rhizobiaceae bacterium]
MTPILETFYEDDLAGILALEALSRAESEFRGALAAVRCPRVAGREVRPTTP